MQKGALKVTYTDGSDEYFEIDLVGDNPNAATNLKRFLASPNVTLINDSEITIIPGTSIRSVTITRAGALPEDELAEIPGVIVGAKRVVG